MLSRFPNWIRFGLLLAFLAGSQTGCQTWKTPSFNMFPWSKKPSADKIVGTKPPSTLPGSSSVGSGATLAQDTSRSSGPVSPATRNTPSPVPGMPASSNPSSMALASNPSTGNPSIGTGMPSPGAAATNNGFTPGNYNIPQNRMPGMPTGSNLAATPNPYASNPYPNAPMGAGATGPNPVAGIPTGIPNSGIPNMGNQPGVNPYGSTAPANASYNAFPGQPSMNYQAGAPASNPAAMQGGIPNLPAAYGGPAPQQQGFHRRVSRSRGSRTCLHPTCHRPPCLRKVPFRNRFPRA